MSTAGLMEYLYQRIDIEQDCLAKYIESLITIQNGLKNKQQELKALAEQKQNRWKLMRKLEEETKIGVKTILKEAGQMVNKAPRLCMASVVSDSGLAPTLGSSLRMKVDPLPNILKIDLGAFRARQSSERAKSGEFTRAGGELGSDVKINLKLESDGKVEPAEVEHTMDEDEEGGSESFDETLKDSHANSEYE